MIRYLTIIKFLTPLLHRSFSFRLVVALISQQIESGCSVSENLYQKSLAMKLLVLALCTLLGYTVADTRVDITLAARDLKDSDLWEPPDTFATVLYAASDSDPYNRVGKTLTVDNSYNPVWTESFTFVSFPGSNVQRIKIEIWDGDWSNPDDVLGFVEFPLNNVINAAGNRLELALSRGTVLVSGRINATRTF